MLRQWLIGLGTIGVLAASTVAVDAATDLPVVDSSALGTSRNLPWSEPVQVNDPFEGNFVGVFDRNYFYDRFLNTSARIEVQSLWSPQSVRFLLLTRDRDCFGHSPYGTLSNFTCSELINSRNVTQLFMRIGDQIFQVSEQNSTFPVDDALAQALQTAPTENIRIRLVTEAGEIVDSEIGQETVEAWKTVYAN
jgi:hypothetical protein